MALRVIENRQMLQILVMFMIVQFSGLALAANIYSGISCQAIQSNQITTSTTGAIFYVLYIVVAAAVLLLLMRIFKGSKLLILIEGVVIFVASFYLFGVLASIPINGAGSFIFGTAPLFIYIVAAGAALALVIAKNKAPNLRNTAAIISSIGVGVILGIGFGFIAALIFMVILAAYDFIAVFITKHMITIANVAMKMNLAFMVSVDEAEAVPAKSLSKNQLLEYKKERAEAMKAKHRISYVAKELEQKELVPLSARMALGTGDLAVPLMLAVAAYKFRLNFILSLFITAGGILGLLITMVILRKYKRALPAIPPLLLGITVALAAYFLIFGLHGAALPATLCALS